MSTEIIDPLSPRLASIEETPVIKITPEEAKARIQLLGYGDHDMQRLLESDKNSNHFVHALAVISVGDRTEDINDVYHRLYPEDEKAFQTDADIQAEEAADQAFQSGAWDKFGDN